MNLKSLCDVITKGTTPTTLGFDFVNRGINFIKIENITADNKIVHYGLAQIDTVCHDKLKRSQLKAGDILFSIAGAIGRCAIVDEGVLPANTNQALAIIRLRDDAKVDKRYLLAYLQSENIINQYSTMKQGVAQLNVSLTNIGDFEIFLPPLEAQQKIANILDRAAALIEKRKAQITKLDLLVKSQFIEMFGDLMSNTKGWEIKPFFYFAVIDTKMTTEFEKFADKPHIGIDSIEAVSGALKDYRTVKEDGLISGKYHFTPNHIIYSKIRPNLNKVALPTFEGLCSADAYPLLSKEGVCERLFLAYVLRSELFLTYILPLSNRTNIPKVNKEQLAGFVMPLPPIELQHQFADFVRHTEKLKTQMQLGLDRLGLLYKSLMQKYFVVEGFQYEEAAI